MKRISLVTDDRSKALRLLQRLYGGEVAAPGELLERASDPNGTVALTVMFDGGRADVWLRPDTARGAPVDIDDMTGETVYATVVRGCQVDILLRGNVPDRLRRAFLRSRKRMVWRTRRDGWELSLREVDGCGLVDPATPDVVYPEWQPPRVVEEPPDAPGGGL